MRGDQLAGQWRIIRAIETSPSGLTVSEIAKREETGIRTIYRDPGSPPACISRKGAKRAKKRIHTPLAFSKDLSVPLFSKIPSLLSFFHSERYNAAESRKVRQRKESLRPRRLGVRGLDDFMRHSFKVMHDELHMVKVRISPAWVRWAGEKIWHESQKGKKNGDGSLELTFRVVGLEEIKRWVLSFGPEAVVLEGSRSPRPAASPGHSPRISSSHPPLPPPPAPSTTS